MRDRRFVACHRGGSLEIEAHRQLAAWAADCAEHILELFELSSSDQRPKRAVEVARAWARGEVTVGDAQKAAVAAHAAARSVARISPSAVAVARAAGHAVATAHMADHSLGAALYAVRALRAVGKDAEAERTWQLRKAPPEVRALIRSALKSERFKRWT